VDRVRVQRVYTRRVPITLALLRPPMAVRLQGDPILLLTIANNNNNYPIIRHILTNPIPTATHQNSQWKVDLVHPYRQYKEATIARAVAFEIRSLVPLLLLQEEEDICRPVLMLLLFISRGV
jgi:hypothetical protein